MSGASQHAYQAVDAACSNQATTTFVSHTGPHCKYNNMKVSRRQKKKTDVSPNHSRSRGSERSDFFFFDFNLPETKPGSISRSPLLHFSHRYVVVPTSPGS